MAYTSGTAANYKGLLAVMATFAGANGWVVKQQTAELLYMMGTGLAGLDEIYCGVQTYEDAANNRYNWNMVGSWGWRNGRALGAHPLSSGDQQAGVYLWNAAIPYWMVANPRRIIVAAKVSTTYQMAHLGLLTPPATDAQYPYPLLIGGTYSGNAYNYSNTLQSSFWAGLSAQSGRLSLPGGSWAKVMTGSGTTAIPNVNAVSNFFTDKANILSAPDGSYLLEQIYMVDNSLTSIYGAIEGLFRVSGYNNSAENIITVGGVNYMVFPDVSRSSYGDYCALRLN